VKYCQDGKKKELQRETSLGEAEYGTAGRPDDLDGNHRKRRNEVTKAKRGKMFDLFGRSIEEQTRVRIGENRRVKVRWWNGKGFAGIQRHQVLGTEGRTIAENPRMSVAWVWAGGKTGEGERAWV